MQSVIEFVKNLPPAEIFAWSIFIGVVIATIAMFCHKYFLGGFVTKLAKSGAESPETAKSLAELSYNNNIMVKLAIADGKPLRKVLGFCLGDEVVEDPFAPLPRKKWGRIGKKELTHKDLSAVKFYLLPDKKYQATTRFDTKGSSPLSLLISLVLITVLFFLLKDFLPDLIKVLAESYSDIGGTGA